PPWGAGSRLGRAGEVRAAALGRPLQACRERRALLLRAFAVTRLNPPRFGGGDVSFLRTGRRRQQSFVSLPEIGVGLQRRWIGANRLLARGRGPGAVERRRRRR